MQVVAFTANQIPGIDDRRYPPELSGPLYPDGIPIHPESELEDLVRNYNVDRSAAVLPTTPEPLSC